MVYTLYTTPSTLVYHQSVNNYFLTSEPIFFWIRVYSTHYTVPINTGIHQHIPATIDGVIFFLFDFFVGLGLLLFSPQSLGSC